ncbi:MAG: hypothetical protein L6R28_19120 [Planctomycetes bacterium]|nr:hypothetical protein [Planctomycetota bacterium]
MTRIPIKEGLFDFRSKSISGKIFWLFLIISYVLNGMFLILFAASEADPSGELYFWDHGHKTYLMGLRQDNAGILVFMSASVFVVQVGILILLVMRNRMKFKAEY